MSHSPPPENRRLGQPRAEGGFALRLYRRRGRGKYVPRLLIKCGCCDEQVEIYHDSNTLEINGVIAPLENWREVLLPLLYPPAEPVASDR